MATKGTISVHTENIFPIIKKFLYSDHEIFLRELVSNAVDATQKLKTLSGSGEAKGELGDLKITVKVDKEAKTLHIIDKGIGMTEEEVGKYINQLAFSSAEEFLEKYKDKGAQVIGHFGLGFYSAFMVAHQVELITKSYKEGSTAVKWTCDGSTEFEISESDKIERGTEVILHLAEDSMEFNDTFRIKSILDKYCKFLPVEIEFEEKVLNNPSPLWTKAPADCTKEEYEAFYKELYPFSETPLFWIHLNVDYPFKLTGILYFPKIKNEFEPTRNKIQLYSNQVFVTDSVQDIVPEFLMLLHGVIDSPDIPLNVSRSYLQSDANVKKINNHITKKVADKLEEIFKQDRVEFNNKWESIGTFVKYGMISEEKFYERANKFCLLQNKANDYFTIEEYKEKVGSTQTDKDSKIVLLYSNDLIAQNSFINAVEKRGYDVLKMDGVLDNHFISNLEHKFEGVSWKRVDSDSVDKIIDKDLKKESVLSDDDQKAIQETFEKEFANNGQFKFATEALAPDDSFLTLVKPEWERRMKEMQKMQGMGMDIFGSMPDSYQVVINTNHALAVKLSKIAEGDAKVQLMKQAFELSKLSQNLLQGEELTQFIQRNLNQLA
ncbi:MAG: molecular chaperone HtpG [Bacteroidia bacterium]|nr:molecular chaperone HtpG [Bacteroidia bacterium]MCF8427707.1 molecular chaperone HtpG [Bacteroidia bacterium]MCF8447574.1 molecular chaperone HtpG [Bacteroidia bacterium]